MKRILLFSMAALLAAMFGKLLVCGAEPHEQNLAMASAINQHGAACADRHQASPHSRILIVIDPGHGGSDPGTHGPNGVDEKTVTLAVARDLAPLLKHHHVRFILTRDRDKYVSLRRRVAIANRNHAALFVSLHCDEYSHHQMHGFTVIYAQGASTDSRQAARLIAKGLERKHFYLHAVRAEVRHLYVLDNTNCPAVLVEMGFMSDPGDLRYLCSIRGQHRLAEGIADGIVDYVHAMHKAS
jgi:N-acetylmuramoyl-L-alanine amidase